MERADLAGVEAPRLAQRMDAGAPERLVGVDVPDARDGALVEDRRLDRCAASGQPRGELSRREGGIERLRPEARGEIRLDLVRLEQEPGAEPPHVPVGERRAVVEPRDRTPVRVRVELRRSATCRNEPVMRRCTSSARPDSKRTIRYFPRRSTAATRSPRSRRATSAGSSGSVSRTSSMRTRSSRRPSSTGASARRTVSTSGSSGTPTRYARRGRPAPGTVARSTGRSSTS